VFEQAFFYTDMLGQDLRIIGYIVPGLIANDMLKQGVGKTLAMVLVVAILIRIVMLVVIF
ncbi:MAG: poly-gamma-glutamate biosynthesis protein PgsC/CapC, partial [Spirochaetia bacterium]|nr:poly-gamma-glutamate biosynthesis protein PgsC/CapC [Spirochaetia bacterium]